MLLAVYFVYRFIARVELKHRHLKIGIITTIVFVLHSKFRKLSSNRTMISFATKTSLTVVLALYVIDKSIV